MSKFNKTYYSKINKTILDLPKSIQKEFKYAIETKPKCKEIPLPTKYEVRKINTKSKDLFRNTVYDYSLKEKAKKKIIDKIEEETKIFSRTYKSISKSQQNDKNIKNVSENIVLDYKSKGYDLKNLFPKDNLFTNSLLLEVDPTKYKNVLEIEPKECKKSINYINHLQNITKGNNFKKYKRIILQEIKEKENYFSNLNNQNDEDLENLFGIKKLDLKNIKQLKNDINLTERTLNNIDNLNLNEYSPIKKNFMEIKFIDKNNYNKNNSNLNTSRNVRKNMDVKLKTMFFNKNNNNRKVTIINNQFKTINNDDKYNNNNNDNKLNHIRNISKNIKQIRNDLHIRNNDRFKTLANKLKDEEYEIDERLNIYNERKKKELIREYKRKKELFDLYNQCKSESFENSEKLINGYLRKYDRISPVKKLNYKQGSNLHGFLKNFMTKTSLTNIPDIIYKVKAKTGDYTIKLKNLDKCVNIDKNINNLEYKYTEDILTLNEDIYKTKV